MTSIDLPTSVEMLVPTLQALDQLGGSGTNSEIDETAIRIMGLSSEQLGVEFPIGAWQKGSKVVYRLPWARTYLKKLKAIDNSRRAIWTLEAEGRRLLSLDPLQADAALRANYAELRSEMRTLRLAQAAADQDGEDEPPASAEIIVDDEVAIGADWKAELLAILLQVEPSAFERLAQRLLREAGFKNVEVLGRSGDGGLDGVGVYRPSLISFPIFFQCKRYRTTVVGPGEVRDFRGAMAGRGEKGLLITTSTFSADAKKEATRDGAPPVELIDGPELCDLLKEFGVGVTIRTVEEVEIQAAYFESL